MREFYDSDAWERDQERNRRNAELEEERDYDLEIDSMLEERFFDED